MNKKLTSIEDFQTYVAEHIFDSMPSLTDVYECKISNVRKNNVFLHSIEMRLTGATLGTYVYLESFYKDYQMGISITLILSEILNTALNGFSELPIKNGTLNTDWICNYEAVSKKLYPMVLGTERNKELLSDTPHIDISNLHLSVVCKIDASEMIPGSSITVTNALLSTWNVTIEQVYSTAMENTEAILLEALVDVHMENLDICMHPLQEKMTPENLYRLSNKENFCGASVFLKKGLLKELSAISEVSFYIMPFNIHETLLLPVSEPTAALDYSLLEDVKDMNRKLEPQLMYLSRLLPLIILYLKM